MGARKKKGLKLSAKGGDLTRSPRMRGKLGGKRLKAAASAGGAVEATVLQKLLL